MFYFNLGVRHITDWQGYDHMLFLLALTLPLSFSLWKPTLRWITAFTLGHSISLAVSALGWVSLPGAWIELAIAVTIAFTVVVHALAGFKVMAHGIWIAGLFGLIHGFGFGSYYTFLPKASLFGGHGFLLTQALKQDKLPLCSACFSYIRFSKNLMAAAVRIAGCCLELF